MSELLTFRNVSFFYGERLILREISFCAKAGRIALVLGPNGAGKSSLLRLMAGLERQDTGEITRQENLKTAYLGHPTFIYPALTARQNLEFWAKAHKITDRRQAVDAALAQAGLEKSQDLRAGTFSRGMAQRLNFSRCLLQKPDLLLLDEPFTGMDQESQELLRQELARVRSAGACIFLVSHDRAKDGQLADEVFCIGQKKLLREASAC